MQTLSSPSILSGTPRLYSNANSYSVIAVHGLGAHPDITWTSLKDPNKSKSDGKNYTTWLTEEDMLPAALPKARIMRYGYASDWFGKDMVQTRASSIAKNLLNGVLNKRKVNGRVEQTL